MGPKGPNSKHFLWNADFDLSLFSLTGCLRYGWAPVKSPKTWMIGSTVNVSYLYLITFLNWKPLFQMELLAAISFSSFYISLWGIPVHSCRFHYRMAFQNSFLIIPNSWVSISFSIKMCSYDGSAGRALKVSFFGFHLFFDYFVLLCS